MKKIIRMVSTLLCLSLCIAAFALVFTSCNNDDSAPKKDVLSVGGANGLDIVDGSGNAVVLRGTNLGSWLSQEGWICALQEGDKVGDQTYELDTYKTLYTRFGYDKTEELMDTFRSNWIKEQDFANIKSLGLNTVRIPFSYIQIINVYSVSDTTDDDGNYTVTALEPKDMTYRADGFKYIDWAVQMCEKYGLYAVLDMHGAVGSQNGDHTSGNAESSRLFEEGDYGEQCRTLTTDIWTKLATKYNGNGTVAMYDILNEPTGGKGQETGEREWNYFDVLYDAIRAIDSKHIISMEGCWMEGGNLPTLAKYGWENVVYQYHHYNWSDQGMSNEAFLASKKMLADDLGRETPFYVGEFNCWGDSTRGLSDETNEEAWTNTLSFYNERGWHWTTWTYKIAEVDNNWGLYNIKQTDGTRAFGVVDIATATAEQIGSVWSKVGTTDSFEEYSALTDVVKQYATSSFHTGGIAK